ncbi:MAG: hypothetical protein V3W06_10200, partial [Acidimicrobiia bacterium]
GCFIPWGSELCKFSVIARAYSAEDGWEPPVILGQAGYSSFFFDVDVAIDSVGNGIVGWTLEYLGNLSVRAALFSTTEGWSTGSPKDFGTDGNATNPRVAIDDEGNAILAWQRESSIGPQRQFEGTIHGVVYASGSGWLSVDRLDNVNLSLEKALGPVVSAGGTGEFFVAWAEHVPPRSLHSPTNISATRFEMGGGWSGPRQIDSAASGHFISIQMVAWEGGESLVVWSAADFFPGPGYLDRLHSVTYSRSSGWGAPTSIDLQAGDRLGGPWLRAIAGGRAVVAAMDVSGISYAEIVAATYKNGQWSNGTLLYRTPSCAGIGPQPVLFENGSTYVAWTEDCDAGSSNYNHSIRGVWISPTGVVGVPDPIPFGTLGNRYLSSIGADSAGRILMTHMFMDAVVSPWWTVWSAPDIEPPPLAFEEPAEGAIVGGPTILLVGSTEPGAVVVVNGFRVEVEANGTFEAVLALLPGPNRITATATDAAGNRATAVVNVTFADPGPALADLLNLTMNQLDQARAGQNSTATSLADAQAKIVDLQAELASASARQDLSDEQASDLASELESVNASLASAMADLEASQARAQQLEALLGEAQASGNATDEQVAELRIQLEATNASLAASATAVSAAEDRIEALESRLATRPESAGIGAELVAGLALAIVGAAAAIQILGHRRTMRLVDERMAEERALTRSKPPGGR